MPFLRRHLSSLDLLENAWAARSMPLGILLLLFDLFLLREFAVYGTVDSEGDGRAKPLLLKDATPKGIRGQRRCALLAALRPSQDSAMSAPAATTTCIGGPDVENPSCCDIATPQGLGDGLPAIISAAAAAPAGWRGVTAAPG